MNPKGKGEKWYKFKRWGKVVGVIWMIQPAHRVLHSNAEKKEKSRDYTHTTCVRVKLKNYKVSTVHCWDTRETEREREKTSLGCGSIRLYH